MGVLGAASASELTLSASGRHLSLAGKSRESGRFMTAIWPAPFRKRLRRYSVWELQFPVNRLEALLAQGIQERISLHECQTRVAQPHGSLKPHLPVSEPAARGPSLRKYAARVRAQLDLGDYLRVTSTRPGSPPAASLTRMLASGTPWETSAWRTASAPSLEPATAILDPLCFAELTHCASFC